MEQMHENVKLQQFRKTPKFKDENCKKSKRLSLRITKHEHEEITQLAKEKGLSISQFVINRAFEQPQLKFDVGKNIAEMDETMNQIIRDSFVPENDYEKLQLQADSIESIVDGVKTLSMQFNRLKRDIYKSYLSDIEKAKLERREKARKNRMKEE